jgi:hypothetical protein
VYSGRMSKPANAVKIQSSKPYQFQKGVSGNPAGKPRGTRHLNTLMRDCLMNYKNDKGISADHLLVEVIIKKALSGNTKALEIIFDRVDGKVQDHVSFGDESETGGLSEEDKRKLMGLTIISCASQPKY